MTVLGRLRRSRNRPESGRFDAGGDDFAASVVPTSPGCYCEECCPPRPYREPEPRMFTITAAERDRIVLGGLGPMPNRLTEE